MRSGQGMLLSTNARNGGSGTQLDSREAQAQIEQSLQLQTSLAETAQKQNAKLKNEPEPAKLNALAQMENSVKVVQATGDGKGGKGGDAGGQGKATAYSEALLQLSTPAGIAAVTPASAVVAAGGTSSLTAGQDGISLFTYGKATSSDKPNQETGIKLHAASGKVSLQSQSDATSVTADKTVTVASAGKSVTIGAKQHVMLTAQGAYLKLEGGNIMIHGPGTMTFKASMKELTGLDSYRLDANGYTTLAGSKLFWQRWWSYLFREKR